MAGHSKWAKIKRDKAQNDAKRGAIFTKLGNQIAIAARQGVNPDNNPSLAMAIETAKAANMPQSTIDRALQRAADKAGAQLEEIVYEGYGSTGMAVLVECATDNRKRTFPEVKTVFKKHGGSIAEPGSVAFNFERQGQIIVDSDQEEILLLALEAGATDVRDDEGQTIIITPANLLQVVRQKLLEANYSISEASLVYLPQTTIVVNPEQQEKNIKLLGALDDLADVVNIYTNLPDED